MNHYRFIHLLTISLLMLISSSCTNNTEVLEDEDPNAMTLISITHFANEQMEWANVEKHIFQESIKTTGTIEVDPRSLASIYSSVSGKINEILVHINEPVKKGQKLCIVESIEFIQIQKEYLESRALLKSKTTDYERTKSLFEKNIASQKDFVQIESQYRVLKATTQALKAQLDLLNVDYNRLENNELSNYLVITAPIGGYISNLEINMGQFINSETQLMSIVDVKGAQLLFPVYSQYLDQIEEGQKIYFYASESPDNKHVSKITSIGKLMQGQLQAAQCLAKLNVDDQNTLLPGMRVQVEILANEVEALAVPNEAIISSDHKHYVLVRKGEQEGYYQLQKLRIELGITSADYTEIIGLETGEVLAKGSYYFNIEE